jgi:hypothetical protein
MLSELSGLDEKIALIGSILVRDLIEVNPEYTDVEFLSI